MQRQSRTQDRRNHNLIAYHLDRGLAQRRLDKVGLVVKRL